ncbi:MULTISPECIES: histidine kinase [Leptolyngbya]|uniref:histidine kinase n=1 Tax=Leptolyngbya TaxID=47251 RepID=UPI0016882660|nr:histidine kinase [Leptolyngbya sp. FACHB-1624]MBD1856105.1 histidine kinase [Leptolyngbya sp. FACHB-1624]
MDQLSTEVEALYQEISRLKQENADLEILLENTTEHSTQIETELHEKNEEMQEYLRHVHDVTNASAAVENGTFQIGMLDKVAQRGDELGQLARVFQSMTMQIKQREEKLKQQVEELKIEIDQSRLAQQVSQITQTEYFQELKQKVKQLRSSKQS